MTKISAYFYPRPPRGGRPTTPTRSVRRTYFYPRPPRGGRPRLLLPCIRKPGNFYPRPPRGGRPTYKHVRAAATIISIHALREEGDLPACKAGRIRRAFLSTPSARRATRLRPRAAFAQKFLSTPSARRATCLPGSRGRRNRYFYPRPPRGGRLAGVSRMI